ncbi:MAG: Fe-S protein assembly chaperone HscA [Reyranellaceae bacterium]
MLLEIHEPGQTPLPHADDRGAAIGIDLGTTNSVVAIARGGQAEALRDEAGRSLIPSVVAYRAEGETLVGDEAMADGAAPSGDVVSSVKRLMGRGRADLQGVAGVLPFSVVEGSGEHDMVRLNVAGRQLSPVEISADILRACKRRAELALDREVRRAVVTVPAYFDDAARTATRDAARAAGLEVLRLVNEPTAAALAYGLDRAAEGLYAVYDLGGGTFDFSLLRLERGVFQVLATGGDAQLGGDDFDRLLAEAILEDRRANGLTAALSQEETRKLLASARALKEALTDRDAASVRVEAGGSSTGHSMTRARLDAIIEPLVRRTIEITQGVIADAEITSASINGVVLVGGSTRVPSVRDAVAGLIGKPPLTDIDPDEVVALGAALQAEALTEGSDTLLLDVTPLSLGLETMGGVVEKIIPRNTPIPVALAQEFTTYQDGQTAMAIHVVQGERELVADNRSLARFELHGIPPMTAGAARIKVTFTVDADGLLTVAAEERTTGVSQRVEVRPAYGLDDETMARMLEESMAHAANDMHDRLLVEARVEARRALAALEAALAADGDLLQPNEAATIRAAMAAVEKAVDGPDRDAINAAVEGLDGHTQTFAERRMDRGISQALKGMELDKLAAKIG